MPASPTPRAQSVAPHDDAGTAAGMRSFACSSAPWHRAPMPRLVELTPVRRPLARRLVLLLELFDDSLRQMRGHLLVVGELLREAAATLRDRAQVEREAQHLRLRHHRLHVLVAVGRLRAEDLAAAPVDVRHDVAEVLLRHVDGRLDERLQQDRTGVESSLADRERAGDLERHIVGVDLVEFPVDESYFDVDHWIAGDYALGHVVDDPFLDRCPEVLRDGPAEDLVLPHEAFASLRRSDLDHADPVLAVAAGLLDVPALGPAVARDRLAVGDARDLRRRLYAVLALELLEGDIQVHVAQAGDDQLLGLLHTFHVQRRIFFAETGQAARDLLLVAPRLWCDRHAVGQAG